MNNMMENDGKLIKMFYATWHRSKVRPDLRSEQVEGWKTYARAFVKLINFETTLQRIPASSVTVAPVTLYAACVWSVCGVYVAYV